MRSIFLLLWGGTLCYKGKEELVCDFNEKCDKFCSADVCEYRWVLRHRHSMTWRTMDYHKGKSQDFPLAWDKKNQSFQIVDKGYHSPDHPPLNEYGFEKEPEHELENIIPGDGRPNRLLITINGEFPGPTIKVRQGSIVKVVVDNQLPTEGATIHWHGILQTDNYWMDGAAFANQCPILSHQNFTYVWRAEHTGSYWYHSHNAIQRNDGVFGGIVIYDEHHMSRHVDREIPLIISDWFGIDSTYLLTSDPYQYAGTSKFVGSAQHHCRDEDKAFHHGVKVSSLCMDSLLVNGRGQFRGHFNDSDIFASVKENYVVSQSAKLLKIRAMHTGMEFPVRFFRLDGKSIKITGTDGGSLIPIEVTELIIGIGETFDIEMILPSDLSDFNIRIQLLAQCRGMQCDPYNIPFVDIGIQRSRGHIHSISQKLELLTPSAQVKPVAKCEPQENKLCNVFNCPWVEYLTGSDARTSIKQCKFIHEAKRDVSKDVHLHVQPPSTSDIPDKIFNVTFNFAHGSSINNMKFQYPKVPLYHDPSLWDMVECPDNAADVPVEGLKCTQVLTAEVGDLVEIRFIGAEAPNNKVRRWMWTYHTAHLHGNEFYLMDMGFPKTFENGSIAEINENLKCLNDACTAHEWNEDVLNERRITQGNIAKNTLLLPAQGYSIVRFRAENPGYWPLHCHNLFHNFEGMALLFNIKDSVNNRPFSMIPDGLPQCANHQPSKTYPWELTPKKPRYAKTVKRRNRRKKKASQKKRH